MSKQFPPRLNLSKDFARDHARFRTTFNEKEDEVYLSLVEATALVEEARNLLMEFLRYSESGCIEYGRDDDLADRARELVEKV